MWANLIKLLIVVLSFGAHHDQSGDLTERIFPKANQSGQYVQAPTCARLLPAGWCR